MMVIVSFLLLFSGVIDTKPSVVVADVYIGTHGPYRFLVDTGTETSLIGPKLALGLRLQPEFRVEVITQHSKRLVPGTKLRTLRLAQRALPETEIVFQTLPKLGASIPL